MRENGKLSALKEKPDEELIRITLVGDSRAYGVLMNRHSRKIMSILKHMLPSEADAYDVSQEAFLKAYRSLGNFNGEAAFSSWLYRIAVNQAYNFLRKHGIKPGSYIAIDDATNGDPLEKNLELVDSSLISDPVRRMNIKDLKKRLADAMDALSPEHREAVHLCNVVGRPYSEVAELLNTKEGTLRSRVHYAHKQLQGLLSDLL